MTNKEFEAQLAANPDDSSAREAIVRQYLLSTRPSSGPRDVALYYAQGFRNSMGNICTIIHVLNGLDHCPRITMVMATSAAELLEVSLPGVDEIAQEIFNATNELRMNIRNFKGAHADLERGISALYLGAAVLWGVLKFGITDLTFANCGVEAGGKPFVKLLASPLLQASAASALTNALLAMLRLESVRITSIVAKTP